MRQGYICANCFEPQETPFPEVCRAMKLPDGTVVGCFYRMRDCQLRDMELKHGAGEEVHIGSRINRYDETGAAARDRRLRGAHRASPARVGEVPDHHDRDAEAVIPATADRVVLRPSGRACPGLAPTPVDRAPIEVVKIGSTRSAQFVIGEGVYDDWLDPAVTDVD